MSYRTVQGKFWKDKKVRKLSSNEKLIFAYFITAPTAHYSGLYYVPKSVIHGETGLSEKVVDKALEKLEKFGIVKYDNDTEEVLVLNMAKHQVKSPQQIKGVETHFRNDVESSELIQLFIMKNNTLGIVYDIPNREGIDRVPIGYTIEDETPPIIPPKTDEEIAKIKRGYGDEGVCKLTNNEYKKLVEKFGEADAKARIQNLENYVLSKGKRYKSHYSTILMWYDKDEKNKLKADKDYKTTTLF